jgi:hypothetical protein
VSVKDSIGTIGNLGNSFWSLIPGCPCAPTTGFPTYKGVTKPAGINICQHYVRNTTFSFHKMASVQKKYFKPRSPFREVSAYRRDFFPFESPSLILPGYDASSYFAVACFSKRTCHYQCWNSGNRSSSVRSSSQPSSCRHTIHSSPPTLYSHSSSLGDLPRDRNHRHERVQISPAPA